VQLKTPLSGRLSRPKCDASTVEVNCAFLHPLNHTDSLLHNRWTSQICCTGACHAPLTIFCFRECVCAMPALESCCRPVVLVLDLYSARVHGRSITRQMQNACRVQKDVTLEPLETELAHPLCRALAGYATLGFRRNALVCALKSPTSLERNCKLYKHKAAPHHSP
jgi:hypothetical protein